MFIFQKNIISNFCATAWTAILSLALVPVYLHYLGLEAYGLIGFFVSLQAVIGVLDLGLSVTANREIARRAASPELSQDSCNLVRTLEVIYAITGLLIALALFAGSSWVAGQWVRTVTISTETVRLSIIIFSITVALRWPVSLYTGVLRGLEKQVPLNWTVIGITTLKGVGSAIVAIFFSPTIQAYLLWQLAAGTVEVVHMARMAWRMLPLNGYRRSFDLSVLRAVWRFTAGVGTISILAAILKQLDKILISKLLPLEQLGYYTVASMAGTGLYLFVTSIFNAAFPRFASLVSNSDTVSLAELYHKVAQFLSFLVAPVAGVLVFFSYELLLLWTRSEVVASNAYAALSVLALANMFNAMMNVPYALQLASGLTWIPLWSNGLSVVLIAPAIYFLVIRYGIVGGAIAWAVINISSYFITPHIFHRYVLPGHKTAWILKDTLPFMSAGLGVFGGLYLCKLFVYGELLTYIMMFAGFPVYACLVLLISKEFRSHVKNLVFSAKSKINHVF